MVRPTHNAGKQGLIFSIITVVQCSPVKLKNVVTPMLPESEQAEKRGELEYKLTGSACTGRIPWVALSVHLLYKSIYSGPKIKSKEDC